jgi:hypothetical protein
MKDSSCLNPKMAAYCKEVRQLEDKFNGLELNHIPGRLNEAGDTLAKMASSRQPIPPGIFSSDQYKPSIRYEEPGQAKGEPPTSGSEASRPLTPTDPEVMELDEEPAAEPGTPADWRQPYLDYLLREVLPINRMESRGLACRAKSFVIIEGELYKRSHTRIL